MSGHTPGPWAVDAYGDVQANGEDVARIASDAPHAAADARLVAAAPDLLHAAQQWLNAWTGEEEEAAYGLLKNAVAKAKGGAL